MSIATERGDAGQTSLPGGVRVSKSDDRVNAYGTIDELISVLGFARALCANAEIRDFTKAVQRELFIVGSAIAAEPNPDKAAAVEITESMVGRLTAEVHRLEAADGILADWSIPGEDAASAAFDVARTVCRRAERLVVKLVVQGAAIQTNALRYLNRLSDLLWLFGRTIELSAGIDSSLRGQSGEGFKWSRAW